jgi:hypothetical protein
MSDKAGLPVEIPVGEPALREHLREIIESRAFKGSRRSQQFLHHIVDKVLHGHAAELKERNLGIELFGRPPSYDTGEDAIVRVTASDLRKRLQQYYSETGSEIRIELHTGSYVPEFRHLPPPPLAPANPLGPPRTRRLLLYGACAAAILLCLMAWVRQTPRASAQNVMPWPYLLHPERRTIIVLSDPDVSVIQQLAGSRLSLSDYANGNYHPDLQSFAPGIQRALQMMRGANAPVVDVGIAMNIAGLAAPASSALRTRPARALKMADFKTDDNFVILGSPRSNPWGGLFQDQLDFHFVHDEQGQELIRNRRPRAGEAPRYVPTARGWATGYAYGVVALTAHAGQNGKTLLLAGTNAEATEAAGRLATSPDQLSRVLMECGIDPFGVIQHFEILLEVSTMAGSSNASRVKACHLKNH